MDKKVEDNRSMYQLRSTKSETLHESLLDLHFDGRVETGKNGMRNTREYAFYFDNANHSLNSLYNEAPSIYTHFSKALAFPAKITIFPSSNRYEQRQVKTR